MERLSKLPIVAQLRSPRTRIQTQTARCPLRLLCCLYDTGAAVSIPTDRARNCGSGGSLICCEEGARLRPHVRASVREQPLSLFSPYSSPISLWLRLGSSPSSRGAGEAAGSKDALLQVQRGAGGPAVEARIAYR